MYVLWNTHKGGTWRWRADDGRVFHFAKSQHRWSNVQWSRWCWCQCWSMDELNDAESHLHQLNNRWINSRWRCDMQRLSWNNRNVPRLHDVLLPNMLHEPSNRYATPRPNNRTKNPVTQQSDANQLKIVRPDKLLNPAEAVLEPRRKAQNGRIA